MGVKYLLDSSGEGILMMGSPLISRRMLLPNSSSWKLANLEEMAIQKKARDIWIFLTPYLHPTGITMFSPQPTEQIYFTK